ncbi:MAG TPA: lysophospholipid acyltransferase family protein [Solirubrobacteraceae bacterium]|jgi:1-acyl-sn-glycerol-3-phosphate acyltransferase|nr:lysophospholipid acyltransferase family protein [Solirubrobacteraceae bacterium]
MVEPIRRQRYEEHRRELDFGRLHQRTRDHDPGFGQWLIRPTVGPLCRLVWRLHHEGRDNIPKRGPVIVAANHASFMDHFFIGVGVPRPVNFVAKSQLFTPATRTPFSVLGAYPVIRGAHDEESHTTSMAILARGSVLVTYPQGGRARGDEFGGRPRPGVGRLMYESGAPVVPTAVIGSAQVREWRRGHFPPVTVRFGTPMQVPPDPSSSLTSQRSLAEEVMRAVRALYDAG